MSQEKLSQLEIYQNLIAKKDNINQKIASINTEIKISNENREETLNEVKEKFGVNSLEELRALRSELFAKNKEEINSLTEMLNEREEEVRLAEEGINKAKNLIKKIKKKQQFLIAN